MSAGGKLLWASFCGVVMIATIFWLADCATPEARGMTARTALGIVKILCPPEVTVGDCLAKVEQFLPPEPGDDAGAE